MNHREPPQLPAGMHKAVRCLSLALLQVMEIADATALPRTRPPGSGPEQLHAGTVPYLTSVGPRPLRFQTPAELPASREVTAAIPTATTQPEDAAANEAVRLGTEPAAPTQTAASETSGQTPAEAPVKAPQPILRDHITPTVRAEDFLPYFLIPGSAQNLSDVTLVVPVAPAAPAPAAIPPSSATYRQTP